jgi:hypothetical protein
MAEIFLPTLHTFAMKNEFTGSCGELRFKIKPNVVKSEANPKEVDMAQSSIFAEYWHGPFCYEKSEKEGAQTFPMSEEGRLAMKAWLEAQI